MPHHMLKLAGLLSSFGGPAWNPFASGARDLARRAGFRRINRLNRSQYWRPARTYQEARRISPFPERPVR